MQFNLKAILPYILPLVAFLLLCVIKFYPQLEGKRIPHADIESFKGMSKEYKDLEKETGERILWTNSMFGGMPTYQIGVDHSTNLLKPAAKALKLFIPRPIGKFFFFMLSVYILLLVCQVNPWLAGIGAVLFGLTTNNLILYEAGHMAKLEAVAFGAIVMAGLLVILRGKYLAGGVLFSLGLGFSLLSNHVQMTYYWALILAIPFIYHIVRIIKLKETKKLAPIFGTIIVSALLAIGSSASQLWPTYEMMKDTMRGEPILENSGPAQSSSETEGLEWNYAMQWSNGFLDVMSNYIPAVVGGSSAEPVKPSYELYPVLRRSGTDKFSYYWGELPFTSGPPYYGAIALLLFVLSLFVLKGAYKWSAIGAFVLITILSMGKHVEWLNRLFFDYFPLYNKFRAHNSAMSVLALLVPVFGILGLSRLAKKDNFSKKDFKQLYIAAGALLVIGLFYAIIGPGFYDFSNAGDQRYEQMGLNISQLKADRMTMMKMDAWRSVLFVSIAAGLIWLMMKNKLNQTMFLSALSLLILVDIMPIGNRYVSADDFQSERILKAQHNPRPVDQEIFKMEKKGRGYYRVYDQSINTFNSSSTSYHHNTIGGYNAAKLQRIQDVIDRYISKGDMKAFNMLNAKYFIDREQKLSRNSDAFGNAWFVNKVKRVSTANQEIDAIAEIDPSNTAVISEDFGSVASSYSGQGSIELVNYRPDKLVYSANVSGSKALAVFSEIWYGMDKGWKAYVDGTEVPILRANYLLRSIEVPAGKHEVKFEFVPRSFHIGKYITLICSGIILLLGGFVAYKEFK